MIDHNCGKRFATLRAEATRLRGALGMLIFYERDDGVAEGYPRTPSTETSVVRRVRHGEPNMRYRVVHPYTQEDCWKCPICSAYTLEKNPATQREVERVRAMERVVESVRPFAWVFSAENIDQAQKVLSDRPKIIPLIEALAAYEQVVKEKP